MSANPSLERVQAEVSVRDRRPVWIVVLVGLGLMLGGVTAWNSANESLWIDELHTAWTITESERDVIPKAALGNQTPVYFAWQWWVCRTIGQSELALRLTSLAAWFGCLGMVSLVLARLVAVNQQPALWLILVVLALDRHQIFFATEARPYMLVCLVNLVACHWLSKLCEPVEQSTESKPDRWRLWFLWAGWLAANMLALWLHPTAGLFVAAQFVFIAWQARPSSWPAWPLALCLGLSAWPMRYVLEPAWQQRQAWSAFAADLSWGYVLRQFPLVVAGVPGLIAGGLVWWKNRTMPDRVGRNKLNTLTANATWPAHLWFIAWTVPCLAVWLLTATQTAPLMHARYLFAGTVPLILWSACMISRVSNRRWVLALVMGMLWLQLHQQGTLAAWSQGRLPVVQRDEGWREAIAHINQAGSHGQVVQVFCASNLIEGAHPRPGEAGSLEDKYLSLPLRAIYPITHPVKIVSLWNDPKTWPSTLADHDRLGGTRWLLVRSSQTGLAKRLQLSGLQPLEKFDFGGVQLVRF